MQDNITQNARIAVVGATGMVGRTILAILEEKGYNAQNIRAVASAKSAGNSIEFRDQKLIVEELAGFSFKNTDFALFSPGSFVSEIHAPRAVSEGAVVIDNTSHFRMNDDVPLVIPEVNGHVLTHIKSPRIIANPNCVLMQLAVALKPLHDVFGVKEVSLSAYQSVCGAGKTAVDEMLAQTTHFMENGTYNPPSFFKHNMAFNLLAEIDALMDNGFTKEEWKIRQEFQKIFEKQIPVSATCVRVPVVTGHAISAHVHFESAISLEKVKDILSDAPGVIFKEHTITPHDVAGKDTVYISRLRVDPDHDNALLLWICADNLRKGAALNAVQIMEYITKQRSSTHAA